MSDGERDAWKQRFDKEHYETVAADWLDAARAAWNAEGAIQCLLCDAQDRNDLIQLFGTLFVPNEEPDRFTVTGCTKHFPEIMLKAKIGGEQLPDRSMYPNGGARATGW